MQAESPFDAIVRAHYGFLCWTGFIVFFAGNTRKSPDLEDGMKFDSSGRFTKSAKATAGSLGAVSVTAAGFCAD
ncbi:MAG: hypothetical protein QM760_04075 [Nibricoccus sp.]